MKTRTSLALLATLITASPAAYGQAAPAAPATREASRSASAAKLLARAELDALLAQPANVLVIDVRRPDEIASIGGFPVYLNVQADDLEKRLAAIPRDRVIVTVSNHAARAGRAADLLQKNGFNVAGAAGAQNYEAEGGTLVKVAPSKAASSGTRAR